MKMTYKFDELFDFGNRLSDAIKFETVIMTATKEIAKVLHAELLVETPVDTGNLRKMWSAGDNLKFTVKHVPDGYEVTLINEAINKRYLTDNYPNGYMYGHAVNYGHRTPNGGWVMGKFFVEKALTKVSETKVMENLIYSELEKWFRWCLSGK